MAKEEKKEEPKQEKAAEAPAEASAEKKRRKVSRMSLTEVESAIKEVKEKMGGFHSGFAQSLLARRKELAGK